jgi:hypothetical protein
VAGFFERRLFLLDIDLLAGAGVFGEHRDAVVADFGEAFIDEESLTAVWRIDAEYTDGEFAQQRGPIVQDANLAVMCWQRDEVGRGLDDGLFGRQHGTLQAGRCHGS